MAASLGGAREIAEESRVAPVEFGDEAVGPVNPSRPTQHAAGDVTPVEE